MAMSGDERAEAAEATPSRPGAEPPRARARRSWSGWIAAGLVAALVAWMASGMLAPEEAAPVAERRATEPAPVAVEVRSSAASSITRVLSLEGDVRPDLSTPVRAEAGGVVEAVEAVKGSTVARGDVIARIAPAERSAQLAQARADVERTRRDAERAESLLSQGFATQARIEETAAARAAAEAALAQAEAALDDLVVRAPAAGVLNDLPVDAGEVVQAGQEVARIVDTDPLVVELGVPQRSVAEVEVGQPAEVGFVTGQTREGRVRFVSANAEAATRTFAVEVEVPNPDREVPAGISAEVGLPVEEVLAHFVSPAILSLGEDGALGVKVVEDGDRVAFYPAELVRAQTDGVWVSGLPERARIITVGQGFVAAGERVSPSAGGAEDAAQGAADPALDGIPVEAPEPAAGTDADAVGPGGARRDGTGSAGAPSGGAGPSDRTGPDAGRASNREEASGEEASASGRGGAASQGSPSARRLATASDGSATSEQGAGGAVAAPEPEAAEAGDAADGTATSSGGASEEAGGVRVTSRTVPVVFPDTAAEPGPDAEPPAVPGSVEGFEAALADDSAAAIRGVQARLDALGFDVGEPTSEENARTRLALARFQTARGLEATGELGPRVLEALAEDPPADAATPAQQAPAEDPDRRLVPPVDVEPEAPAASSGSIRFEDEDARARAVEGVQAALAARGFDAGPVDGIFGQMTRDAVVAFQVDESLPVTGEIDARLIDALDLPEP